MKEWAHDPERDANVLGVKQSGHVSKKGKLRGFYCSSSTRWPESFYNKNE
jgi:hypothetical protein